MPELDLERGAGVRMLPRDFFDILCNRYFPVLSLTYIASVLGIALKGGNPIVSILQDSRPYDMALWVALWVAIPAMFWIVIRNSMRYAHAADVWYQAISGLMCATLLVSFLLFPEREIGYGLRMFFVATIPVFFIQYYFFVRNGLPALAAWPLTIAGIVAFLYGQLVL
jgi:hypothetical protein